MTLIRSASLLFATLAVSPAMAQWSTHSQCEAAASLVDGGDLALVENAGQWDSSAVLAGRLGDVHVQLLPGAIHFQLVRPDLDKGIAVRLTLEGGDADCIPRGEHPRSETRTYLSGRHGERSRSNVASFRSALYEDLTPGVDLRLREGAGRLEWDLLLDAGVSSEGLVMRCDGVDDIAIDNSGDLVLETELGPIRMGLPTSWTVAADGATSPVESSYHRLDNQRFGFTLSGREEALPVVIDPGVEWSTYVGGTKFEVVLGTRRAPGGNVYICGITDSSDFPTTVGAYEMSASTNDDGFVSVFDPTGSTLLHSTYMAGAENDGVTGMDIGPGGEIVIAGYSYSDDFPTTAGTPQPVKGPIVDAFVAQLDASLSTLQYSTFLGGDGDDWATDVEVDSAGAWSVCGITRSVDFPVTAGAYQSVFGGASDVFVARVIPNSSGVSDLEWSSFLGGSSPDAQFGVLPGTPRGTQAPDLAIGADGSVTVSGATRSDDFPTTAGAFQAGPIQGFLDGFVARLSADGSSLHYSTLVGGASAEVNTGVDIDGAGRAIVCGGTISDDFPVTLGAYQTTHGQPGGDDVFVFVLNANGTGLDYSTLLGKAELDFALSVAVDASGIITLGGATESFDFPTTTGAAQVIHGGGFDGFISRLDPSLVGSAQLTSSTLFGGADNDDIWALDLVDSRSVLVGGATNSKNLPVTPGSFEVDYIGGILDGWVALIELEDLGKSYCNPAVANSTGQPGRMSADGSEFASANDITLTASSLPPMSFGMLLASQGRGFMPMPGGSQGNLCLGGPIGRYQRAGQIQSSGAAGQIALALDLSQTPTPNGFVAVQAGETWNFQMWHRDLVAGTATSNFTEGLEISFL